MQNEISILDSVENLYRVFAVYPRRKHVEGCPCCVNEEDRHVLETKSLRLLSSNDLGRYAFKAMTTWGDVDDFRHFLPRIFELLAGPDGIGYDAEVILGKLALGGWKQWPDQEQAAVRDYCHAVWNEILLGSASLLNPEGWLCGLGCAGEDLTRYLDAWADSQSEIAYEHLAEFIDSNQQSLNKHRRLTNSFWHNAPEAMERVCNWLVASKTHTTLERIYLENTPTSYGPALARAIQHLETLLAK